MKMAVKIKMGKPLLFLVLNLLVQAHGQLDILPESTDLDTGGLSRDSFPKDFVYGTATSAYQVEGAAHEDGRGDSIWDVFIKQPGLEPNNASGEVAVDQYHRYKEDVDLMAKLNIFFTKEKQIITFVSMFSKFMDVVQWCRKDYADFADFFFKMYGDRAKNWFTFNKPRIVATLGYDNGYFAPSRCSKPYGNCTAGNSGTEPYAVAHNLILCHASAVQKYREKYQKGQRGRIGILLDFTWYEPLTRGKSDEYAAQRARDFHLGWFLHPIVYGEYPKTMQNIVKDRLPKFTNAEIKIVKGSADYVGINHYTTYYMQHVAVNESMLPGSQNDWHVGYVYAKNGVPIGPKANSDWLFNVPWGLYKAIMYIKERYGNPTMFLSENGMDQSGDVTIPDGLKDRERINYYRSYIQQLKKTVDDGANVIGYFAWSLLDNFEWRLGYTSRFGITFVDFKTLKRTPKMSAYWFQKMLKRKH